MLEENALLALVRVRGTVGVRKDIAETLKRLHLPKPNNLSLANVTKSSLGMINKCSNYITFGEIDESTLSKLFEKSNVKISQEDIKNLVSRKKTVQELGIKLPIRLHPPRHGYKSTRKPYKSGGALGYRGKDINKLIERML